MKPDPRLVALVDATLHRDDRVVDQLVALLDQHPREHGALDRAVEVLQREDRHLVALLGELAGEPGDHPAEGDDGSVLTLERFGDGAVDLAAQRGLDAEQRVVAHVEPEHLLLELQPLGLVELELGDGDALVEARIGRLGEVAEQAHHALVALAATDHGGVDDLFEHHQQALARQAEVVERTGLDQRLDRSLVEHGFGHSLDEVVERLERSVGVAFGEQLGDEALAHVADGRQAEGDRARAADRQLDVLGHLVRATARRSPSPNG